MLEIDANFEKKMTCGFINDIINLVNFTDALRNLEICTFERLFCSCYKMVSQQTTDALCVITLKGDSKFEEELTGGLKNDISFNRNSQKSKTLHFDELVL